ncbi:MAG: hypothetical protein JW388_0984 [Nitrospira sp.]|nr:hypothetical protein [Nitrospira sp.]
MSTWHQDQATHRAFIAKKPLKFWHDTKWTVVIDPPNDMRCMARFATEEKAKEYQAKCPHSYILPPGGRREPKGVA